MSINGIFNATFLRHKGMLVDGHSVDKSTDQRSSNIDKQKTITKITNMIDS